MIGSPETAALAGAGIKGEGCCPRTGLPAMHTPSATIDKQRAINRDAIQALRKLMGRSNVLNANGPRVQCAPGPR